MTDLLYLNWVAQINSINTGYVHTTLQREEDRVMSPTSEEEDETRMKEICINTDLRTPTSSNHHYWKTLNHTSERYQTINDRPLCRNCDLQRSNKIEANKPTFTHQNMDSFTENSSTEENAYESVKYVIHPRPSIQTCTSCSVPICGSGYLHPVACSKNKNENKCDRNCCRSISVQGERCDFQNVTGDSRYAYVDQGFSSHQQNVDRHIINMKKYKFFRNGFYIMSVLNFMFLLLNVVGLPFMVIAIETRPDSDVQEYSACYDCDVFNTLTSQNMTDAGIFKYEGDQCCVKDIKDLLPILVKDRASQQGVERNYKLLNTLLTRRRSAIQLSGSVTNARIVWRPGDVREGIFTYDEHGVHVNTGGTYHLYIKIGFKQGSCGTQRKIGYDVNISGDKRSSTPLAAVQKLCLNGTTYEQDLTIETIFKVPMGQKRQVFVEIAADMESLLKHHTHTFAVFEL